MKHKISYTTLILLLIFSWHVNVATASATPKELSFEVINSESGLKSNYISGIIRDQRGFMYFSTLEGLSRYDGNQIKYYQPISSNNRVAYTKEIRDIVEGEDGVIWIATANGLYSFDTMRELFTEVETPPLKGREIITLEMDKKGHIWLGTKNGLYIYNPKEDVAKSHPQSSPTEQTSNNIRALYCDKRGDMWIGYWGGGLSHHNAETGEITTVDIGEHKGVISIYEQSEEHIYIGTWGGAIIRVNRENWRADVVHKTLSTIRDQSAPIYFIERDSSLNNYWIGTNHGLYILDNIENPTSKKLISTTSQGGKISNNNVALIYYDPTEELIWLGTRGGGVNLHRLSHQNVRKRELHELGAGHHAAQVRGIIYDNGSLWILEKGAGLFLGETKGGEVERFTHINSGVKSINSMIKRRDSNEILLATQFDGVASIKWSNNGGNVGKVGNVGNVGNVGKKNYSVEYLPTGKRHTTTLFEDNLGRIWMGCNDGVMVAEERDGVWSIKDITTQIMCKHRIVGITQDADRFIWLATRHHGVKRIRMIKDIIEQKSYDVTLSDNTPYNNIMTIYSNSKLWLGMSGIGALAYNKEEDKFQYKESLIGQNIGVVNSMLEVQGALWLGTNSGVYYYTTSNNNTEMLQHLTTQDGLVDNLSVVNAITSTPNGDIYIGSNRGYTTLDADIFGNTNSNTLEISDIQINNQSALYSDNELNGSVIYDEKGAISRLSLSHNQNSVSFMLTTLQLQPNAKSQYTYTLEGREKVWRVESRNNEPIHYNNLPWGRYTFKAYNSNAINPEPISVKIVIARPFYLSWGAIIAYLLIILFIARDMINNRVARRRMSKRLQIDIDSKKYSERATVALDSMDLDIPSSDFKSADEIFLAKAIEVVNANIDNSDFEVANFVEQMCVTNSMLYRKLKTLSGMTPNEFVRHIRLHVAHKLITEKYRTITTSEAAYAVGFNIPKYFTKCFNKEFGYTPTQYREKLNQENQE